MVPAEIAKSASAPLKQNCSENSSQLSDDAFLYGKKTADALHDAYHIVAKADGREAKLAAFRKAAKVLSEAVAGQWLPRNAAEDRLHFIARSFDLGAEAAQQIIIDAMTTTQKLQDYSASIGVDVSLPQPASVILKTAESFPIEPVCWLWPGFVARGKMQLLGGAPGTGKTTLAMTIAAIASNGGYFPDGSKADVGRVVIWSGEDDPSDTLVPRLKAAGADLSRVHFVDGVRDASGSRSFDPAHDISKLEQTLRLHKDVSLLVVDPVVSTVAGDSHKSNDVRRALQPLVDMISRLNIAAIGITHFSKGTAGRDPTERITGSVAFGALARIVLAAAKDENSMVGQEGRRILTRAKSNIGLDGGGFSYRVEPIAIENVETTRVAWGEPLHGSAREILGGAESHQAGQSKRGAVAEACEFLKSKLEHGPVSVKQIEVDADEAGISKAALRRAYERGGTVKCRNGFGPGGIWSRKLKEEES